jgi:hypothetical protein
MSGYSMKHLVLKTRAKYGWSMPFSEAYTLERHLNGVSHERAFREAMNNPLVRQGDKPR